MTERPLERVRNTTGEARYIYYVGEEQWPVNRLVGVDEVLQLPDDLALRMAEQPGWAFEGNETAARRRVDKRAGAEQTEPDAPAEKE